MTQGSKKFSSVSEICSFMDFKKFTNHQRKVDDLIVAKKYLAAYEQIRELLNQHEENLTGEQVHYLLNLQSNTKYAAESQVLLKIIGECNPQPQRGTRISRGDIQKRAIAQGGDFQWTTAELERTIDYIILHDLLPAH